MHCLAQWAAASSATAPAMRALRSRSASVPVLAPGGGGVPGHRRALLDGHQHVGQRVLDRLELPDGPPELDPHLGVLRRRLEAPAGDPRALGGHQEQGQGADLGVGHEQRSGGHDQPLPVDRERPERPGGVEGRERLDRHLVAHALAVEEPPPHAVGAPVQRHEHEPRRGQAQHGTQRPAEGGTVRVVARVQAGGTERHGRRDRAVGQAGQQGGPRRLVRAAGHDRRHEECREDGPREEGVAQLLEDHGHLGQREPLATRGLGEVESQPPLGGHLLPHRRQVRPRRRRFRHGPRLLGRAVRLQPAFGGAAE